MRSIGDALVATNPYRYLKWLFQHIPLAQTADEYVAVLPWNMPIDLW
jgi:hypothetical protein